MKLIAAAIAALCLLAPVPALAATDTVAKVRTDLTTLQAKVKADEAAAATAAQNQAATVAALQGQLQAMAAAAVTPAPVASTGFPGIDAAGLQAVFYARPGLAHPTTKPFAANRPATWQTIVGNSVGSFGPFTGSDFDFTGFEVYFNGSPIVVDNARFGGSPGGYTLAVGHPNGGSLVAQMTLTNSVVDEFVAAVNGYGSSLVGHGSTFAASNVSFLHASLTDLNIDGNSSLTDVYFDRPGQNPTADAHTEGVHYFSGSHQVLRAFFDGRGGAGKPWAHATGLVYVEAANDNVDVTIKDTVFMGAFDLGLGASIQVKANPGFTAKLTMINVVLEAGNSPAPGNRYAVPVGGTVKIVCQNCRDAATGQVVDAMVNALTP